MEEKKEMEKNAQDTGVREADMNELDQASGAGLVDWVAQNIGAPVTEFWNKTMLNTAQSTGHADLYKGELMRKRKPGDPYDPNNDDY